VADSLRAELLAIKGIASAELEGTEAAPHGVKVQLAAGADAKSVGVEVQRVLASYGMRSHRAEGDGAATATTPASSVAEATGAAITKAPGEPGPPPPPGAGNNGNAAVLPMRALSAEPVVQDVPVETAPLQLQSVSVEESRDGISVRVRAGDEVATRQVGGGQSGMDAAVIGALAELLGADAELVAVQRGEAGDATIVTVLLEVADSGQQVGSAVVVAGDAYAVAQAAWRALRAPE